MSKRNVDKKVYEQYIDATVALFMEHYAAALTDAAMQTETAAPACSETLDQRCMGMIQKEYARQRRKAFWKGTKCVLRCAAILLIALLSLSSILFMTVEAFRVPVINFFIEQGDGFWAITGRCNDAPIEPAASNNIDLNDPLAGLLPEGYALESVQGDLENGLRIDYANTDGNIVQLWIRPNASDMTMNSEYSSVSKACTVAGNTGAFVFKDDLAQLAWLSETNHSSYLLRANNMDENMLLSVAEQFMKKISK